jgi:hypothetical protein
LDFTLKYFKVTPNSTLIFLSQRVLIRTKGKNFSEFGGSEVSYREAIVADLDHLSQHHLKYDTPPMMVGRTRLCQVSAWHEVHCDISLIKNYPFTNNRITVISELEGAMF